jgi:hypothetical protein
VWICRAHAAHPVRMLTTQVTLRPEGYLDGPEPQRILNPVVLGGPVVVLHGPQRVRDALDAVHDRAREVVRRVRLVLRPRPDATSLQAERHDRPRIINQAIIVVDFVTAVMTFEGPR